MGALGRVVDRVDEFVWFCFILIYFFRDLGSGMRVVVFLFGFMVVVFGLVMLILFCVCFVSIRVCGGWRGWLFRFGFYGI